MDEQLSFFGASEATSDKYCVFLAIMPDSYTRAAITELAHDLRARHGLSGKVRPIDHLHVSLHRIGDYVEVPERVVHAVGRACEKVCQSAQAFDIAFNKVLSFRNRSQPLVLGADEIGNEDLAGFYKMLGMELAKEGIRGVGSKFTPHVTMLYDRKTVPEELVDPISWRVGEVVLIRSEVGETKYSHLGRWELAKV